MSDMNLVNQNFSNISFDELSELREKINAEIYSRIDYCLTAASVLRSDALVLEACTFSAVNICDKCFRYLDAFFEITVEKMKGQNND